MRLRALRLLAVVALVFGSIVNGATIAAAEPVTGTIDGAAFKIEIPPNWNHKLVLYSHGYVPPGQANPPVDVGDPLTGQYLLSHGYALAGSAYKSTGWAVEDALQDQVALLKHFGDKYGKPSQTIAWGHSLGGMITAGLVQRHPDLFAGALPMCGVLAGAVGVWNSSLDAEFVFKTLLAPNSTLQLVHITDPTANLNLAETILAIAQSSPQGRARIALVAAIGDLPGWYLAGSPEPAATDFTTREANQFAWDRNVDFPFAFALRAEVEARAGGNPSWNTGVDYRRLLRQSINSDEVQALYAQANLRLEDDLDALEDASRIAADSAAVRYTARNIVFNGDIGDTPVMTMHTTGDGLVVNQHEQAYASVVEDRQLLRQTFVHRAGHCTFTPAETVAAFSVLEHKINTHRWSGLSPAELNAAATALGAGFNVAPPAYVDFTPTRYPRPFSVDHED